MLRMKRIRMHRIKENAPDDTAASMYLTTQIPILIIL
jgi:hypothetical protein